MDNGDIWIKSSPLSATQWLALESGSGGGGSKNMLWNKYYFTTLVMGWSSETLDSNNHLW